MRRTLLSAIVGCTVLVCPAVTQAATLYVSPSGAGIACTVASPCGAVETAYRSAAPGDAIELAAGVYGAQTIPALGRPAPSIEIRGAEGATPVVGGLDVRADHVVVRGVRSSSYADVDSGNGADPVEDVRFFDVAAATHWLSGTRGFTWTRGSIGPAFNAKISMIGGTPTSYDVTYDGVLWHDATRDSADVHTECLLAAGVQGLTIRNSRFSNCAVFDVLISKVGDDPDPSDVLIENTVLEPSKDVDGSNAYYSLMTGLLVKGLTLRNNVWGLGISFQGRIENGSVVGNIGETAPCLAGVSYSHNVFTDRACGATDRVVAGAFSQFADPANHDWRLKPGAAAIDAGDPRDYPATDALGAGRPAGAAPDAGAYEFGGVPVSAALPGPGALPGNGSADAPTGAAATDAAQAALRSTQGPAGRGIEAAVRQLAFVRGRVVGVLGNDSLRVRIARRKHVTVRLLGVDPPAFGARKACGARRARAELIRITRRRHGLVRLLRDPSRPARDRTGRRQAYVMVGALDVGLRLIHGGWAKADRRAATIRRVQYVASEQAARQARRGAWRACPGA